MNKVRTIIIGTVKITILPVHDEVEIIIADLDKQERVHMVMSKAQADTLANILKLLSQ
jgi:hypothetical protein